MCTPKFAVILSIPTVVVEVAVFYESVILKEHKII